MSRRRGVIGILVATVTLWGAMSIPFIPNRRSVPNPLRRWQFRRNIVRFVPRFLKAIISQKQGEKQQITEYNWENKVYEVGAWMR